MRNGPSSLTAAAGAVALAGAMVGCATAYRPARPAVELPYPSPLAGPGVPALAEAARSAVTEGWHALENGDNAAAVRAAVDAGGSAPAILLGLQATAVTGISPTTVSELAKLAAGHPDYAAAWLTLSRVAEASGDEPVALDAARRGAALWSSRPWRDWRDELQRRWIDDRLARAGVLADGDDPNAALPLLDAVLRLVPDSTEALLLKARVLIDENRPDEAAPVLADIHTPDATLLSGRIAEERGDWATAMAAYQSLPASYPGRAAALEHAQTRWRLSNQPAYVQQALAAPALDREQLAVLLVALAPQLDGMVKGRPPLLSDIVDLPSHREIVVAVGCGLLHADLLEHRFHPQRPVTARELRDAVDGLTQLLGAPAPVWCDDATSDSCLAVPQPINGSAVAELLLPLVREATR